MKLKLFLLILLSNGLFAAEIPAHFLVKLKGKNAQMENITTGKIDNTYRANYAAYISNKKLMLRAWITNSDWGTHGTFGGDDTAGYIIKDNDLFQKCKGSKLVKRGSFNETEIILYFYPHYPHVRDCYNREDQYAKITHQKDGSLYLDIIDQFDSEADVLHGTAIVGP